MSPILIKFQSAPHFSSEANESRIKDYRDSKRFNPRLTSAARRTFRKLHTYEPLKSFNPRLTSAARRTYRLRMLKCILCLFQSAPHFSSEANKVPTESRETVYQFQSAPHFSSEANPRIAKYARGKLEFQSAPHFSSEANS